MLNTQLPLEEDILNQGLYMAMEFGGNWLQPVDVRLKLKFNHLSDNRVSAYDVICRKALDQGHSFVMTSLVKLAEEGKTVGGAEFKDQFDNYIKAGFVWINKANLEQLYSQGVYYAWKEGFDKVIID